MTTQKWQTIWITGASTGIGRELAVQLAATGARVAVSARSSDKLDKLAEKHANLHAFVLDVSNADSVAKTCRDIEANLGPIDLVIFNAGISATSTTAKPAAELYRNIIETNYLGVTNGLAAIVPKMIERGHGHISWVASLAGYNGLPGAGAYNASKAALFSLAESSRLELAPKGIDLTIINPGFVRTHMTEKNRFPMPFMVEPEKAAQIIIRGLRKKSYEITFPWQIAWFAKFLRLMPYPVFFWIVRHGLMRGRQKNQKQ